MSVKRKVAARAAVAAVLVSMAPHGALSSDASVHLAGTQRVASAVSRSDISVIRGAANGTLLAVGRLDAVSLEGSEIRLLGNSFVVLGTHRAQSFMPDLEIGDTVALFGDITREGYFVSAGIKLSSQYVPGASNVYLLGLASRISAAGDRYSIGSQAVAIGDLASVIGFRSPEAGELVEIIGTQPTIDGLVLASWQQAVGLDWNYGGQLDASVGTGKTDASVGTGKTDASVGTGKTDASVGTGKTDASVGTGKTDASVGTGKTDASVGTGKTDASVGTGKTDASVGTGKTDASVGTGKTDASVGTGKIDASVGTG